MRPTETDTKKVRILVVKLGAIGDIVHTLPILPAIRRSHPEAVVSWVVEARSAEILRGNNAIDDLIEVDTRSLRGKKLLENGLTGGSQQLRNLRRSEFDIAIDFQGLLKSAFIAKISGSKRRWGFSRASLREPASRVFYTDIVAVDPQTHVVRQNLDLLNGVLGIESGDHDIEFPIASSDTDVAEADAIVEKVGPRFAMLNPAGGWVTKLWPAKRYAELADRLWDEAGLRSVVTTGPHEEPLADQILAASRSGSTIAESPSLKGFYELAKRAEIYVGGDTGPTHLAIAAGTPVVGLFGPTEWWRNGSLNPDDICVERLDIDCRVDCHRRTCSKWICMDIESDVVFEAVGRRLAMKSRREEAISGGK